MIKRIFIVLLLTVLNGCASSSMHKSSALASNGFPAICDDITLLKDDDFRSLGTTAFNQKYKDTQGRKLVVFMDGTNDNFKSATHIARLYQLAVSQACSGKPVIPLYVEGVGAHWYDFLLGASVGQGVGSNIRKGYRFLARSYIPGDEIYVFGFSRGAFEARSLNGMIEYAGLLNFFSMPQKLPSVSEKQVANLPPSPGADNLDSIASEIYESYHKNDDGTPGFEQKLRSNIAKRIDELGVKTYPNKVVVSAIGVFDTVAALGVARDDNPDNHRSELYANVGYHALSLDEQRNDFRLLRFDDRIAPGQKLEEVWFPGVHSDVGGGYSEAGLESISLHWMLEKFTPYGIFPSDHTALVCESQQPQCEGGELHDEFFNGKKFKLLGISRRKPNDGDKLHGSMACRMGIEKLFIPNKNREPDGRYVPVNLKSPIDQHYTVIDYKCANSKNDIKLVHQGH